MCPGMQVEWEGGRERMVVFEGEVNCDILKKGDVILPYLDMCLITLVS